MTDTDTANGDGRNEQLQPHTPEKRLRERCESLVKWVREEEDRMLLMGRFNPSEPVGHHYYYTKQAGHCVEPSSGMVETNGRKTRSRIISHLRGDNGWVACAKADRVEGEFNE